MPYSSDSCSDLPTVTETKAKSLAKSCCTCWVVDCKWTWKLTEYHIFPGNMGCTNNEMFLLLRATATQEQPCSKYKNHILLNIMDELLNRSFGPLGLCMKWQLLYEVTASISCLKVTESQKTQNVHTEMQNSPRETNEQNEKHSDKKGHKTMKKKCKTTKKKHKTTSYIRGMRGHFPSSIHSFT